MRWKNIPQFSLFLLDFSSTFIIYSPAHYRCLEVDEKKKLVE